MQIIPRSYISSQDNIYGLSAGDMALLGQCNRDKNTLEGDWMSTDKRVA